MQRVPQRKHNIIQHNLVLIHAPDNIHHDVALALVQHDPVVVEDYVGSLLCGLFEEAFFERFLGF
jgi:hypothetical protein